VKDCVEPMHRLYNDCLLMVHALVGSVTVVVRLLLGSVTVVGRLLLGSVTVVVRLLLGTLTMVLCFLLVSSCTNQVPQKEVSFSKDAVLNIATATGEQHSFEIEIADTEVKRVKGLMNRYKMDANQGMLFIFDYEEIQSFWMKNTYLSLDMVFISADYRIVDIYENAFPLNEAPIISEARAKYVLELLGGTVKKSNISIGDLVEVVKE